MYPLFKDSSNRSDPCKAEAVDELHLITKVQTFFN